MSEFHQTHQHDPSVATNPAEHWNAAEAASAAPPAGGVLAKMLAEVAKGRYDKAISLAPKFDNTDWNVTNVKGVCLMRLERYSEAINLFRGLVLQSGCTWMRQDRPLHFKTNFATALLLGGHPNGCLQVLAEVRSQAPRVDEQLRSAIKDWERTLSWWVWLNWVTGRIEPENQPVKIDFEPGDFGFSVATVTPNAPQSPNLRGNVT